MSNRSWYTPTVIGQRLQLQLHRARTPMKSAVRPALLRFAVIDEKLRSRSWPNASSLARELEVTPRTIHRDFEFLRDQLRAPIVFDSRKNGYYYSDSSYQLPYFPVTEGECVA